MKRLYASTFGLALALALAPAPASAQVPADCAGIQNAAPVSPYVKLVLSRAKEGLSSINGSRSGNALQIVFPGWIRTSLASVAGLLDVRTGVIGLRSSLLDTTTCLHLDEMQIECALADARAALRSQIEKRSLLGMLRSQALLQYLQERRIALSAGGQDGTWLDVTALDRKIFDTRKSVPGDDESPPACGDNRRQSGEECDDGNRADGDGCNNICQSEMCPYSSDYGEPVPSLGLGCDLLVLNQEDGARANATPIISQEVATLSGLLDARATLVSTAGDRTHESIEGCVRGWCEADKEKSCGKSADCGSGGKCLFGRRVCDGDHAQRCSDDDACGTLGPCTFVSDARVTTPRGAFGLEPETDRLTTLFVNLRGRQGGRRAWPEAFRNPDDYPPEQRVKAERADRNSPNGRIERATGRNALRSYEEAQGVVEGLLFATALDGHLRIAKELQPLRDGVRRLGLLAREPNGTRQTARNLAYYILRTCIHRPCNEKLLAILRITFADACFPYTNGEYLTQDALAACADAVK